MMNNKEFFKRKIIFFVVAIIGLISAMVPFVLRYSAELRNRSYEIVVDYLDFRAMVAQSNMSEEQWLDFFSSEGVNTFAVTVNDEIEFAEDDADKLVARGFQVVPMAVYTTSVAQDFSSYRTLLKKYSSPYSIIYNHSFNYAEYINTQSWDELLGYLDESGTVFGIVERTSDVYGGYTLLEDSMKRIDYNAVGTFYEWPYVQNRYQYYGYEGAEEITNALYRSVAERNARIVIFRMILDPSSIISNDPEIADYKYITDPEEYSSVLQNLERRLCLLGYKTGDVCAIEFGVPSIIWRVIEGFGVVSAAVILLDLLCAEKLKHRILYALEILGCLAISVLALNVPEIYKILLSIAGGIVMPSIAAVSLCRLIKSKNDLSEGEPCFGTICRESIMYLIGFSLVCLTGSIFVQGALTEINYMLEIKLYRGVKFMQLVPIVVFCLAYFLVFLKDKKDLKSAIKSDMKKYGKYIAVLAFFAIAAGVYYIFRTGNAMITPVLELRIRAFLENLLLARPRTKEFLIGWPCLMLFVWSARRRLTYLPFFFGGGMIIGMTSIVNTFLHIRIQLGISLMRSAWGLLLGFCIGIICIRLAELIYKKI